MNEKDKTLYVVSGFMRTGTSMVMRALEAGGLDAQYRQSRDEMKDRCADEFYDPNVGGLYELEQQDYRKFGFPHDYEGKLIKALSLGVPSMSVMPHGIRVVFMRRDHEEIRQSYDAFFGRQLPMVQQKEPFEAFMDDVIEKIRNRKDVLSCDVLWYRDVVDDPRKEFQKLLDSGWQFDLEKAVAVVDPQYCHFKREELTEGII